MSTPTPYQQATDYEFWSTYVDPKGIYTEEQFRSMTVEEKLEIIKSVFGEKLEEILDRAIELRSVLRK